MACTGGMSCWKLSVSSLLTQQGPAFGLSAQYGGPGVTVGDVLITEYGITVSLPATQQVSSRLVSLASPS